MIAFLYSDYKHRCAKSANNASQATFSYVINVRKALTMYTFLLVIKVPIYEAKAKKYGRLVFLLCSACIKRV